MTELEWHSTIYGLSGYPAFQLKPPSIHAGHFSFCEVATNKLSKEGVFSPRFLYVNSYWKLFLPFLMGKQGKAVISKFFKVTLLYGTVFPGTFQTLMASFHSGNKHYGTQQWAVTLLQFRFTPAHNTNMQYKQTGMLFTCAGGAWPHLL